MKYLCILFITISHLAPAQLITKKQQEAVRALHSELTAAHTPGNYILKGGEVLTMEPGSGFELLDIRISDGQIIEIGSDLPAANSTVIDVSGEYLTPGLTDSHVHFFLNHQMTPTWLLLSVLHGVTSVRDMAGEPGKLELRDAINQNQLLGPTIYQAGPIINGRDYPFAASVASSPEQARTIVQQQQKEGFDFIKVYNDLSPEVLAAIVQEADALGIPVGGHVPDQVELSDALGSLNTIEHLTGYLKWEDAEVSFVGNDQVFHISANEGVWNCPTLYQLVMNWNRNYGDELMANSSITPILPDKLKSKWSKMLNENVPEKTAKVTKHGAQNTQAFYATVSSLHDAKAGIIAGTDAGNLPFLIPGLALHQEMEELHEAGLTNLEVLQSATINASLALQKTNEFGTIATGKRADILVLSKDPTLQLISRDIISGVVIRGIWLSEDDIEQLEKGLEEIFD